MVIEAEKLQQRHRGASDIAELPNSKRKKSGARRVFGTNAQSRASFNYLLW